MTRGEGRRRYHVHVIAQTSFGACRRVGVVAFVMLLLPSGVTAREKIDVVTLANGDRVTGEIKQLDVGILTLKTHHMGTVEIEWVAVASVESEQSFELTDADGATYYGMVSPTDEGTGFQVLGPDGLYFLGHQQIVRIAQIEDEWWRRWRGYVDLGVVLASANSQQDFTLDASAD